MVVNDIINTRVLIATPVLLLGGTEIQMLSTVQVLITGGYNVTICCYYEFEQSIVTQFKNTGAEVILMKLYRSDGLGHLGRRLINLFKEIKPDILHVQYLAPGLVPILAARLAGVPTVFSTIHIAGKVVYGKKAKFLLRIASWFCTAFFCVSKAVEEFWFGSSQILDPENPDPTRKHFSIYNAVDINNIVAIVQKTDRQALRASLGITDRPVIGIVGRLAFQKGQEILLDAMVEIIKTIPKIILLFIGEGPDRMKLEDKAKSLGIENHILWLGVQQQDRVFQLYSIMDLLAMPSRYEGFGLTAAEAMAAGIPVVGTKIEGLSEIIEDGVTGYLIPANDSRKLSDALLKLLTDSEKAKMMGTKGSQRVKELFSIEVFKISVLAAYEKLSK